ncbi:MAG: WYL domain-containing protein [Phycisphaerales bacterium]
MSVHGTIERVIKLLTLLHGSKYLNASLLAETLGVTERTVYRDLKRLEKGGIPIRFDEANGGYAIDRRMFLPPVELTTEEACAILLLCDTDAWGNDFPLVHPASSGAAKLRAMLPESIRDMIDEVMPRVQVHYAASEGEGAADVWSIISDAIAGTRTLRCQYDSVHSQTDQQDDTFLFDPYELYFGQRAWYVIGLHHGRLAGTDREIDAVRTLKLARFSSVIPTDATFVIPDSFSLDAYLGHAWRMIKGSAGPEPVRIRFSAESAETVAETIWHKSQEVIWNDDQSIEMHFHVDGLDEIIWWVLGYGPHAQVLAPDELARRVADLARQTAQHYTQSPP